MVCNDEPVTWMALFEPRMSFLAVLAWSSQGKGNGLGEVVSHISFSVRDGHGLAVWDLGVVGLGELQE